MVTCHSLVKESGNALGGRLFGGGGDEAIEKESGDGRPFKPWKEKRAPWVCERDRYGFVGHPRITWCTVMTFHAVQRKLFRQHVSQIFLRVPNYLEMKRVLQEVYYTWG